MVYLAITHLKKNLFKVDVYSIAWFSARIIATTVHLEMQALL